MKFANTNLVATAVLFLPTFTLVHSFAPSTPYHPSTSPSSNGVVQPTDGCSRNRSSTARLYSTHADNNFLLEDFMTADGEVVNPYKVLKVGRNAVRQEIRQSYRKLSKKYHPDGVRFRKILPGKCNNLEDVRDEWERINLSYDILTNKKMRQKYDRHTAIEDPAAAFGRFALNSLGWGVGAIAKGVGRSIFAVGEVAVKTVSQSMEDGERQQKDLGKEFLQIVLGKTVDRDMPLLQGAGASSK